MNVRVKTARNNDPFLVVVCVLLLISTIGFGLLAIKNARPYTCDNSFINDKGQTICQKVLKDE